MKELRNTINALNKQKASGLESICNDSDSFQQKVFIKSYSHF